MTREYYSRIAEGFDRLAADYDVHYPGNPSLALMRRQASETLARLARPGSWWLEVGCGTGRDAMALAERGVNVLALDISPGMLEQLRAQIRGRRLAGEIILCQMGTGDLAELLGEWEGRLEGAALLFGAMNYEPQPERVPPTLWRLLQAGGRVVAAVRNRFCPWEIAYYLFRHPAPRLAFRRFRGEVPTDLGGLSVAMRVYSPRGFARRFRPWFRAERVRGQSVALPPYMVENFPVRFPRLARRLEAADAAVGEWPVLRSLGDHFLMVLARNDACAA